MLWYLFFVLAADTVTNPVDPPQIVTLTHELTLGGDDAADEAIFSGTTTVAVDSKGRIYVNDPGSFRVAAFAPDGRFLHQFGKRGPGPGEFDEPVALAISQDILYVFDTGHKKLAVFLLDGTFQREVRFQPAIQAVYSPVILDDGHMAFTSYQTREGSWVFDSSIYDQKMKVVKVLQARSHPMDFGNFEKPGFWRDFLTLQFELYAGGLPYQAGIGGKYLLSGSAQQYEGHIFAGDGTQKARFVKEHKPKPFNEAARFTFCEQIWQDLAANPALTQALPKPVFNQALNKTEFPPGLLPMSGVSSFGDGFVVLSAYDVAAKKGRLDFFNGKGRYLAAADYAGPFKFLYGADKHVYLVGYDEDDAVVVHRYLVSGL